MFEKVKKQIKRQEAHVALAPVRVSWVRLKDPDEIDGKYKLQMLIPKDAENYVQEIQTAIAIAAANKFGDKSKTMNLRQPVTDGDTDQNEAAHGHWKINAKTARQIKCLDLYDKEIDPAEVYSGCWCSLVVKFYGYDSSGNKGVGCALEYVKKVGDDDQFGGVDAKNMVEEFDMSGFIAAVAPMQTAPAAQTAFGASTHAPAAEKNNPFGAPGNPFGF